MQLGAVIYSRLLQVDINGLLEVVYSSVNPRKEGGACVPGSPTDCPFFIERPVNPGNQESFCPNS